jgi:hypothetical protein
MTRQILVDWLKVRPFRPFKIETDNGRTFHIRRRWEITLSDQAPNEVRILTSLLVVSVNVASISSIVPI